MSRLRLENFGSELKPGDADVPLVDDLGDLSSVTMLMLGRCGRPDGVSGSSSSTVVLDNDDRLVLCGLNVEDRWRSFSVARGSSSEGTLSYMALPSAATVREGAP